jgi:outer membrane biosynthesis protein TonB
MTDKTKRIVLISVCCLLCVAAAIGIAVRFGGNAGISSGVVSDDPTQSGDPSVNINNDSQTDLDVQVETPDASKADPAQGADSSGQEQTIQADPVKPEPPEKPEAPAGTTTPPDDHDGADVPEEERKTEDEAPPTYNETPTMTSPKTEPAAGSTNSSGQVYVPGFGYVENSGENTGIQDNNMYENGNKIGEMGGG